MNAKQAVDKIAELLNLKFGKMSFATTKLTDGTEITNNMDEEFKLGQELFVVGESTLTPAPAGTHETMEGLQITVDSSSIIIAMEEKTTEAPADESGESESEVKDEAMAEETVEVEVPEEASEVMTEEVVQAVVEALAPIVEEVKSLSEEMKKMKEKMMGEYSALQAEFDSFKKQPEKFSIMEKKNFKSSVDDYKLEIFKSIKK